jgi:hypothetical protein
MDPKLEEVITRHVTAGNRSMRSLAWLVAGGAVVFGLIMASRGAATKEYVILAVIMGGLFAWFWKLSLRDPRAHPVMALLRDRPGDVVWAYVSTTRQNGSVVRSEVMLGLPDKRRLSVNAAIGEEQELLDVLGRALPSATLGFSPERERAFLADPASLRRQTAV